MKSHWFLRITVYYVNLSGHAMEIKGNVVFSFESTSFLPGTVVKTLKEYYRKSLCNDGHMTSEGRLEIFIDSVIEVDEDGVTDFCKDGGTTPAVFSLRSTGFGYTQSHLEIRIHS